MRLFATIGFIFFSALVCSGQLTDDFSDGDFTNNPAWTPDIPTNWLVANGQLRSNSAVASSTLSISAPSAQAINAQWEFYVNLQFNTSSNNFVDVYLTSSNASMTLANGYFVRIGGTPDEISLYKSTAGVAAILINGTDGITNTSNNILKIKVTRNAANLWKLERDITGTGNSYIVEGTVSDNSFGTSSFFGIRITQSTASFFNKHFFDDFYVGALVVDTTPPTISSINATTSTELIVLFNEPLDPSTAQTNSNFTVDQGIGNPISSVLQSDLQSVKLIFSQPFPNGIQRKLTVSNVKDVVGNATAFEEKFFLYFNPAPTSKKDIIITEIFADPSPQIGLPDAEFIELFNRSKNPINIANWKLSDGSSIATFPSQIILPSEYWIVTASSSISKFVSYKNVIGLTNFPTLNNDGDALTLKTTQTIDSVKYQLTWYQDEDKQNGGWSLELIDTENICGEANNWIASNDTKGGTPGKQNSVAANKPDLSGPKLLSIVAQPSQLVLKFDEKLGQPLGSISIEISPAISISKSYFNNQALTEIKIELNQSLIKRQLYSIRITNLRDCAGNLIQSLFNKLEFALPEPADSLDIIINEILFNPRPSSVDFVEVFNKSDKYINLKNFSIANYENDQPKNLKIISDDLVIKPMSFIAFTSDTFALKTQYPAGSQKNFYQMFLPSFNDDAGSVALVSDQLKVIDYFEYSASLHSPLLKDKEGVSLERISAVQNSNEPSNWKSASSTAGFATPGYLNSNSRPESVPAQKSVFVEPEIFSPQRLGLDFSKINYRFDQTGFIANVKILDAQGRLIKTLAINETLSFEGFLRWDGDRDDGNQARLGYYLVWFEVFDLTGIVKTYRERIVLAGGN